MQVRPGDHVLDVGCGLGGDVRALAALVGPTGRAVGIDASEAMIAEARKRSEDTGLPVEFAVGDAHRLGLPDGSFDACRTERTLHHVAEPARAVAELARVTRPGGHVVAVEADHETVVIYPGDKATTRRIAQTYADSIPNGWIDGRHLVEFYRERMQALGALTSAEANRQPNGSRIRVGGLVITRQAPSTAGKIRFFTLEDEHGHVNVTIKPDVYQRFRREAAPPILVIDGVVQSHDGVWSLLATAGAWVGCPHVWHERRPAGIRDPGGCRGLSATLCQPSLNVPTTSEVTEAARVLVKNLAIRA